jgi:hypothetical protein
MCIFVALSKIHGNTVSLFLADSNFEHLFTTVELAEIGILT